MILCFDVTNDRLADQLDTIRRLTGTDPSDYMGEFINESTMINEYLDEQIFEITTTKQEAAKGFHRGTE